MARKRTVPSSGTLVVLEHESQVLADNPLGDPHVRKLAVWLPPQYDDAKTAGRGRRLPVLYDLVGFTGSGLAHTNWKPFGDNVPERAARLIHERKMGPAIFVFPDCFTSLGGNQYVNSSAIGAYADYLTKEIIPFVDREFRTLASREHRGCFGKSSGGYGAIIHAMKYAKHWGAVADHSGDAYFEFVYQHDWPNTLNELAKYREPKRVEGAYDALAETRARKGLAEGLDDGRVKRFLDAVWKKEKLSNGEGHAIMNVCMAATYDPDPKAPLGFRLPFNLETGERAGRAVAELAEARPDPSRPQACRPIAHAEGHLRRLRLARPVPHPLRRPDPLAAAGRIRHSPYLRGIRRQSLRRRLPDGREPAVSVSGAQALAGQDCVARCAARERSPRKRGADHAMGRFSPQRQRRGPHRRGKRRRRVSGRRGHQAGRRRAGRHRDREPDLRRQSAGDDRDDRGRRSDRAAGGPDAGAPGIRPANRADARAAPRAERRTGSVEGFCRRGAGRHRGRVGFRLPDDGREVRAAAARPVSQRHSVGVAGRRRRRPDPSTARRTATCISTPRSSACSPSASARPANSRRRT